jgi:phosphoribosylformylglycinamidine cyclo-ligase
MSRTALQNNPDPTTIRKSEGKRKKEAACDHPLECLTFGDARDIVFLSLLILSRRIPVVKSLNYKESGVDIHTANVFVKSITPMVRETFRPEVLTDIGGFGALFSLQKERYRDPVLVSSTDGVGTKLKVAFLAGRHDTVGIDLVAMCVNDVVVQGAEPLFFLDYLAVAKLAPDVTTRIIGGVVQGCKEAGCALIGGETAELPGMYRRGEYDLAGFCVGVVERDSILDGSTISVGDAIIGMASSGMHSNGYSLARRLFFQRLKWGVDREVPELGRTLGEELLIPTRIYVRSILNLLRDFPIKGLAHITGGGLLENIPRVLPEGCGGVIRREAWEPPAVFQLIRKRGKVPDQEMFRVFNNGIGMVVIVAEERAAEVMSRLRTLNETAYLIGEIVPRSAGSDPLVIV